MERLRGLLRNYREQLLYLVFGGLTTLVNWVVYALLMLLPGFPIEAASGIAPIAAILFAYVTNRRFVFESRASGRREVFREFLRFLGGRAVTFVIEWVGVPALYHLGLDQTILGIEGALAKVIVSVVVIVLNYVFSKWFVFTKQKASRPEERKG